MFSEIQTKVLDYGGCICVLYKVSYSYTLLNVFRRMKRIADEMQFPLKTYGMKLFYMLGV